MKRLFTITILAMCTFVVAHAQNSIQATVSDEQGNPIPYVTVYNGVTKRSVITNKEGKFDITCQPGDGIFFTRLGYQEQKYTAGELQHVHEVTLKGATVEGSDASMDAKVVVRKFLEKIKKNYPVKAAILKGVYKESCYIENECYGFFQSDLDILINHLTSGATPAYKTKIYNLTASKHPDLTSPMSSDSRYYYIQLWLFRHSFLWNFTRYEFRNAGTITYNGSKLSKITFQPLQIDKSVKQFTGTMYIDLKSFALVYFQYDLLPDEAGQVYEGRWGKYLKEESSILFGNNKGKYYPAYVIFERTLLGIGSEWEAPSLKDKENIQIEFTFNFFTEEFKTDTKGFVSECQFYDLNLDRMVPVEHADNIKSDVILETEQEKLLDKRYWKAK